MEGDSIASGSVADRPWGQTLGLFGLRGITGQLTLVAEDKRYGIAFDVGAIVSATSPLAADSVARIALTNHLVSSSEVANIARRIAAAPDADEVDVLAETARLSPEQILKLRRRIVVQRAARTFAIDRAEFAVEHRLAMPTFPGNAIDVRAVVYLGARMYLSEERLAGDLRHFGAHFVLKKNALEDLSQFEFTDDEQPIIDAVIAGTSLPELEATQREIDPRIAQAVVYALACCGACEIVRPTVPRTRSNQGDDPGASIARTRTEPVEGSYGPIVSRTSSKSREQAEPIVTQQRATTHSGSPVPSRTISSQGSPSPSRTTTARSSEPTPSRTSTAPTPSRTSTAPSASRTTTGARPATSTETDTSPDVDNKAAAAEAFRLGELELRRDQPIEASVELAKACALDPTNVDYQAIHAWALFCASSDRPTTAVETRRVLEKAVLKADKPQVARFYLGRVERMLGHDREALRHFREVLDAQPNHADAASEVRAIEARIARNSKR